MHRAQHNFLSNAHKTRLIELVSARYMLDALHLMQHGAKKSTAEPSNDAISPFPACSSIPGEKGQFKYYLEVNTNRHMSVIIVFNCTMYLFHTVKQQ